MIFLLPRLKRSAPEKGEQAGDKAWFRIEIITTGR